MVKKKYEENQRSRAPLDMESRYLTYKLIPNSGATGGVLADYAADVLEEFNSINYIKAILVPVQILMVKQSLL